MIRLVCVDLIFILSLFCYRHAIRALLCFYTYIWERGAVILVSGECYYAWLTAHYKGGDIWFVFNSPVAMDFNLILLFHSLLYWHDRLDNSRRPLKRANIIPSNEFSYKPLRSKRQRVVSNMKGNLCLILDLLFMVTDKVVLNVSMGTAPNHNCKPYFCLRFNKNNEVLHLAWNI